MNWKILLFSLLLLPVLVGLGCWQLLRAQEKEQWLQAYQSMQNKAPQSQDNLQEPPRYARVSVSGVYSESGDWLLDNQIREGRFGYRVFTPFCLRDDACVLVERGWIPGDLDRSVLPTIPSAPGRLTLEGRADQLTDSYSMGANETSISAPYRVQTLKLEEVRERLPGRLADWVLRLDPNQPGALMTVWEPVVMGPEKHYGYAVQWFAMALALVALTIWKWRRGDSEDKQLQAAGETDIGTTGHG
ncbi:SURF1 family protein [Hahella sp. CR1]|uniref:SURF1 family protein n=1 Tax=Hahella sp. CR1 TaxID=2992807 RepID=UPI0024412D8D|nr:SURF1 family protein [Hahella sp. CR1]MDG9666445.1 SURF1 family protein [Hahella sp. CR1]